MFSAWCQSKLLTADCVLNFQERLSSKSRSLEDFHQILKTEFEYLEKQCTKSAGTARQSVYPDVQLVKNSKNCLCSVTFVYVCVFWCGIARITDHSAQVLTYIYVADTFERH